MRLTGMKKLHKSILELELLKLNKPMDIATLSAQQVFLDQFTMQILPKGTVLAKQGCKQYNAYVMLEGEIGVLKTDKKEES